MGSEMTTLFTADTHFFHKNIIKYCNRPFNTVEDMNEELIKRWNETVAPDDLVYHLGDFGLGRAELLSKVRHRLNGRVFLVLGNHDTNITRTKWMNVIRMDEVYKDELNVCEFSLHHHPVSETVDPFGLDRWHLVGHIHEKWRINGRQLNVGVDVNDFRPISIEKVRADIKEYEILIGGDTRSDHWIC